MREIRGKEKAKRGCSLCADVTSGRVRGKDRSMCPHAKCPYTVLDKYATYDDYINSDDSKINVSRLFTTGGSTGRLMPGAREVFHWSLKASLKKLF